MCVTSGGTICTQPVVGIIDDKTSLTSYGNSHLCVQKLGFVVCRMLD